MYKLLKTIGALIIILLTALSAIIVICIASPIHYFLVIVGLIKEFEPQKSFPDEW